MKSSARKSVLVAVLLFGLFCLPLFAQVRVWEEELVIPTWELGPTEVNPTFSWSSSRQEVYPYPYKEILTDRKVDKGYRAVWLENEYIKVLVLPEIGGRLHGAQDKTNGYNFFYWQPTIKPALVGMTGAWISGGIEWNFPHGHRPTGFSPVQHRIVENDDGSKTVWVGETEFVHRVRWVVGLTIFPGSSVIEAEVRLMNPTPLQHSFQMWTTTAVNANEDYQTVFPTRLMTGHGKFEYFNWPVHEGRDISWWKNVPNAASFFAVEPAGFFGGWDHGKDAGTVIAGNPHTVIGKKFWTWGTSPSGRIWDDILSDGEGPYVEPQAGGFSDNQPDYHWLQPGEVKTFKHFFYPVRDIGPFKFADRHGALNLDFDEDEVNLGVYWASRLEDARIQLSRDGETVFEEVVDIDPAAPFVHQMKVPGAEGGKTEFELTVTDQEGVERLRYSPEVLPEVELPDPTQTYPDAEEIESNDALWHAAEITYKFRDPESARDYLKELLRRDPGDSRANILQAELEIKQARYSDALELLETARRRDPDNGKIFYLQGVAEEALHQDEAAYQRYYRSVHFAEYLSRAYERIALIDMRRGRWDRAARHIELALESNRLSPELWTLKGIAARKSGDRTAAVRAASEALRLDPLSPVAAQEKLLMSGAADGRADSSERLLDQLLLNAQTGLESAAFYASAGRYEEALQLLERVEQNALVSYYEGYLLSRLGEAARAREKFRQGGSAPVDGVFAFRREGIDVFKTALEANPSDGRAHYFLGLVYGKLSDLDRAIEQWEEAVRLDSENVRAWRNLGLAMIATERDLERGRDYLEKALQLDPGDSRVLLELDEVNQELETAPDVRLALLEKHEETVRKRDALMSNLVDLLIQKGDYRRALDYLEENHFNSWEGNYAIHNAYMEALIGLAEQESDPEKALEYYRQATLYPKNLEVAPREPNLRGFLYYPMARLYRETGDRQEAERLLELTAAEESRYPTAATYYRALALRELGREREAETLLGELEQEAEALKSAESKNYRRTDEEMQEALGFYYQSLVERAGGRDEEARASLQAAREGEAAIERRAVQIAQRVYAQANQ